MFRRRVGDYLLGRTLGEGTSARVKYGVHAETGAEVAVKVISRTALAAASTACSSSSWLTREIRILRKVHHPAIVELTDVLATKDKVCGWRM
jgi:serine/threonine protein kinase